MNTILKTICLFCYLLEHCSFFINLSLIYKFTAPRFFIFSQNIFFLFALLSHIKHSVKSQELSRTAVLHTGRIEIDVETLRAYNNMNDLMRPLYNNWNV